MVKKIGVEIGDMGLRVETRSEEEMVGTREKWTMERMEERNVGGGAKLGNRGERESERKNWRWKQNRKIGGKNGDKTWGVREGYEREGRVWKMEKVEK